MKDIVIVSAARTGVGKFGGSLAKVSAPDLGAVVIREVLARAKNLDPALIGEVIMGQVLAAGAGRCRTKSSPAGADEVRHSSGSARFDHQCGVWLRLEGGDVGRASHCLGGQ